MAHLKFNRQNPLCKTARSRGAIVWRGEEILYGTWKEEVDVSSVRKQPEQSERVRIPVLPTSPLRQSNLASHHMCNNWQKLTSGEHDQQCQLLYTGGCGTILVTSLKGGCLIKEVLNYAKGKGSQSLWPQSSVTEWVISSLLFLSRHLKTVIEDTVLTSSIAEILFPNAYL